MKELRCIVVALSAATLALWSYAAAAQDAAADWPSKPITLVAPFGPGGSADQLGRLLAEKLTEKYGQRVVVENRPGNSGVTGSELVARADPDGHTLVVSSVASHVIAPAVNSNVPYDPAEDFTHIAFLGGPPTVLSVNAGFEAETLDELIAAGKTADPKLRYAVPGYGTHGHLIGEYFQSLADVEFEPVAYKGGGEAAADLVGGHVPVGSNTLLTLAQHFRSGALRPLALTTAERLKAFPDVPTFTELGYPELVATTWFAVSGPKGMPQEIVEKLNADIREAMSSPDVAEKLEKDGVVWMDLDIAAFNDFFAEETERWTKVAEETDVKVN